MKANYPEVNQNTYIESTVPHCTAGLSQTFLKPKFHFSVTALTDAAGNPEADIFSLQGTSKSQLLALREPNKCCPKNCRILLCTARSPNKFWL